MRFLTQHIYDDMPDSAHRVLTVLCFSPAHLATVSVASTTPNGVTFLFLAGLLALIHFAKCIQSRR